MGRTGNEARHHSLSLSLPLSLSQAHRFAEHVQVQLSQLLVGLRLPHREPVDEVGAVEETPGWRVEGGWRWWVEVEGGGGGWVEGGGW